MSAIQTLQRVREHAEGERDRAAATLRRTEAEAGRARLQLEQLESYRLQYEQRWSGRFAEGADIAIVRCYQSFVGRLAQATAQQARAVERCEAVLRGVRAELQACEMRVAALGKLIERRSREASLALERRERRQGDESAALSARLREPALGLSN